MAAFTFSDKAKAVVGAIVPIITASAARFFGADSDAVFLVGLGTGALSYIGIYFTPNAEA